MSTTADPTVMLESGDRLTRAEFHRRYCARPDIKKAELVEGVVYVASPVRHRQHGGPHGAIIGWLFAFAARTPGVQLSDNATVFLDADNELQPDACLFYDPPRGSGGARLTTEGYIEGAPPLVVEIASSSASYDLHDKLRAYRRNGVLEYIVWRVIDGAVDWLRLHEGEYLRVEPDARGVIESTVFPGLRLHVPKLLAGDYAGVMDELERGLRERDGGTRPPSPAP
jgi:Uma2 family endonuclease